jgi:hypothetical protein
VQGSSVCMCMCVYVHMCMHVFMHMCMYMQIMPLNLFWEGQWVSVLLIVWYFPSAVSVVALISTLLSFLCFQPSCFINSTMVHKLLHCVGNCSAICVIKIQWTVPTLITMVGLSVSQFWWDYVFPHFFLQLVLGLPSGFFLIFWCS